MTRRDAIGVACVLLVWATLRLYRLEWFEPPSVELACLHGGLALICGLRTGLSWLIRHYLIGTTALACGIWAMAVGRFAPAVAACCLGVAAMVNYNFSWGLLAAALGAWVWLRAPVAPGLAA